MAVLVEKPLVGYLGAFTGSVAACGCVLGLAGAMAGYLNARRPRPVNGEADQP